MQIQLYIYIYILGSKNSERIGIDMTGIVSEVY